MSIGNRSFGMNRRTALCAAIAGFFLTAASGAAAQLGGGFPGGTGGMGRRSAGGDRNRDRGGDAKGGASGRPQVDVLEVTLLELHEDLHLSQPQEYAWQKYADQVRAIAGDVARQSRQNKTAQQMTLLQRIDRAVDAARDRFTAVEEAADSAKALYAMLNDVQKAAADPRLANVITLVSSAATNTGSQEPRKAP